MRWLSPGSTRPVVFLIKYLVWESVHHNALVSKIGSESPSSRHSGCQQRPAARLKWLLRNLKFRCGTSRYRGETGVLVLNFTRYKCARLIVRISSRTRQSISVGRSLAGARNSQHRAVERFLCGPSARDRSGRDWGSVSTGRRNGVWGTKTAFRRAIFTRRSR